MSDLPAKSAESALPLWAAECAALNTAAKRLDAEAQTWAEGFAVREADGTLHWDKDSEWAHVRYVGLKISAENIRKISARFVKKAIAGGTP